MACVFGLECESVITVEIDDIVLVNSITIIASKRVHVNLIVIVALHSAQIVIEIIIIIVAIVADDYSEQLTQQSVSMFQSVVIR